MTQCKACQGQVNIPNTDYVPVFPVYCTTCQAKEDAIAEEYERYIEEKTRQVDNHYARADVDGWIYERNFAEDDLRSFTKN